MEKKYFLDKNIMLYKFYKNPKVILDSNEYFKTDEFTSFLDEIINDISFIIKYKISFNKKIKEQLVDNKNKKKEEILNKIKNDNYLEPESCYLYYKSLDTNYFQIIDNLICNNEFVDIICNIKENIDDKQILLNIYEILTESIKIKEYLSDDYEWIYDRLDKNLIKDYKIEKAKELLKIIYQKMNQKRNLKLIINNKR